ncbi:glutathione S-transferase N-terminal domain-containing protein [Candidatus Woesearchaeota archaeon]|nr:glutathione S-transferase N-terminal domain-containing protein [Candidatus Woesearchaeota archaeon]
MPVKIYTTPTCPWCHKAKEWLKQNKIKYIEKNVAADEQARKEMIKKSGQMGVPVLEIKGKIIVGFDRKEIQNALKQESKKA